MTEELPSSNQGFIKKFQDWFGDPVPADPPFPTEADHSIGDHVPTELPFTAEAGHLNHRTRRRRVDIWQKPVNIWRKPVELLSYGCGGAVFLGGGVIFIIAVFYLLGWYNNDWLSPIVVIIFLATLIGFTGGLTKGYFYQLREGDFYKDEF